ncbi:uncharacterized protein [Periplaneta americana]|uniref:uncharacterized protein isoform X2 n=1 Tax=Periplaneta americana TaxID=6978 RepID=UPI0037E91ACA
MSAKPAGETSGFLDVKVPARVRRRRGLAPWKAWKNQWVTVRGISDAGVEVHIGSSCVHVPSKSILCRTESRSRPFAFGVFTWSEPRRPALFMAGSSEAETQRWMQHIRDLLRPPRNGSEECGFPVSFIDNAHSRVAGLTGIYGNLVVGTHRLTLHDPHSGHILCTWKWQHLHQFHLAATGVKDDHNKICIIHTSGDYCAGAGQLHLFSLRAPELLDKLLTSGRVRRLLSSPLPSPPPLRRWARRLSRSESDLHCFSNREYNSGSGSPRQHQHFMRHNGILEKSHSGSSDDYVQIVGDKVANSLISAGLGLLFSTPACSEADTESLHEYQQVGSVDSDDCDDDTTDNSFSLRRESCVSVASGIYEEISDSESRRSITNHYENPACLMMQTGSLEDKEDLPPPLPPRKLRHHFSDSVHEDGAKEYCYRTPPIPAPWTRHNTFSGKASSCSPELIGWMPPHRTIWATDTPSKIEPDYLPMSPDPARVMAEEQHYTVMASINST